MSRRSWESDHRQWQQDDWGSRHRDQHWEHSSTYPPHRHWQPEAPSTPPRHHHHPEDPPSPQGTTTHTLDSQATSNPAKLTLTLLNSSAWHFLDASRLLNGLRNMD